jgi:hypothetical protein
MTMGKDRKRQYRELKREVKKRGNRQRRHFFKDQLRDNPEEAHLMDWNFEGKTRSESLNGMDTANQIYVQKNLTDFAD